jgi:hypothetical protein
LLLEALSDDPTQPHAMRRQVRCHLGIGSHPAARQGGFMAVLYVPWE